MSKIVRLTVSDATARMLELGHPWVLVDAATRKWPRCRPGELAELCAGDGRLLATALLDPEDRVVARVLEFATMRLNRSWLRQRLQAARQLREATLELAETDCYRLVNGEGDGLPGLTVDCYGDCLLLQYYCGAWQAHEALLTEVLEELFAPRAIAVKERPQDTRSRPDGEARGRWLIGTPPAGRFTVQESGLNYRVELVQGLHSGLFLDQRDNRRRAAMRLRGRRFLNLFAFTGAFSVVAAASGARQVTSVDVSAPYLDWARENFEANRLNPKRHEFIVEDCLVALAGLARQQRQFDAVLLDPPSFSTTRKGRFTTRGGTSELVAAVLPLLAPGGVLWASSNHQKVDYSDYLKELRRGALAAQVGLRVTGLGGQPADFPYPLTFPEGRYLKWLELRRD